MNLKNILRLVTPPIIIHLAKKVPGLRSGEEYGLSGDYASWAAAKVASTGYDSENILEKTRSATIKVKNSEAVYERDSVLFDEVEYTWPVLAGLMWVAARSNGTLHVLDFGGSLGSTYFQNRVFLESISKLSWNIVEQPGHVDIGRAFFEDDRLKFYKDIEECLGSTQPNVVILSSVLQYLEQPYTTLNHILELPCDFIIIDRTPFWGGPVDRLCVQTVPPEIYSARYPSWIFSRARFYSHLGEEWQTKVVFTNPDHLAGPVDFNYQGAIIVRSGRLS